jgi:hypothetical protein
VANTSDNFYSVSLDTQTAIRDYLNTLYGTTNADVNALIQRFLNERTTSDNVNRWQQLISASQVGTS